jgi:hypothetical protein
MCVKSLKVCIRRVIEKQLSCKLSKRMYYYTRKRGNHFYQCFIQFYIILIHKFVVSRLFRIQFCSDLSDYRPFRLLTLLTIDPSNHWPFGLMNWHAGYMILIFHDPFTSFDLHQVSRLRNFSQKIHILSMYVKNIHKKKRKKKL